MKNNALLTTYEAYPNQDDALSRRDRHPAPGYRFRPGAGTRPAAKRRTGRGGTFIFAPRELLQEGRGEIQLRIEADVPGPAARRRLSFENHHQRRIGSYLVNGLMSRDPDIHLAAQQRSNDQSYYQLDYTDGSVPAAMLSCTFWSGPWGWMHGALIALIVGLALIRRRAT